MLPLSHRMTSQAGAWLPLSLAVAGAGVMGLLVMQVGVVALLAAMLALVLGLRMIASPESATLIVIFALYANLGVVAMRVHGVPQAAAAGFFLLLAVPLFRYLSIDRQGLVTDTPWLLLLAYVVPMLISALFSRQPEESLSVIANYLAEGVVLYLLIVNAVRTRTVFRKALWTIVLAGAVMGSASIIQQLTGAEQVLGGLGQTKGFALELDEVEQEITRLGGPLNEKNRYAQILVVLLPIGLCLMRLEQKKSLKIAAGTACIAILAGILLTFSRGAGVTALALLLFLRLFAMIRTRQLLVYAAIGIATMLALAPQYLVRLRTVSEVSSLAGRNTAGASLRGRATENIAAAIAFLQHPLTGVGPGQSKYYIGEVGSEVGYRRLDGPRRAHNMYLEQLAEVGLPGFALFTAIVVVALRNLGQARRQAALRDPAMFWMLSGIYLAILCYLVNALFLHLSYQRYWWFLLALGGAAFQIWHKEARKRAASGNQVY